ncbi:hypothetical protein OESDEN_22912 [Oesophagostomum dentatum]|uniref:Uncharacterized protein n=1 Tax=Oesophagostomum dentatum TaxID=61180 RepID=A0A0B1RWL2_OESDE|nr:hypothetical protein OESDEN_22912 [Oesophagostomum dentatum]
MVRRGQRLRLSTCSFEEIAESEEEDIQIPERTPSEGRSPHALTLPSPFAEKRPASPQSPMCARFTPTMPWLLRYDGSTPIFPNFYVQLTESKPAGSRFLQ